jgi:DNA-binding transcriptional regulator GbsR (MarR family)
MPKGCQENNYAKHKNKLDKVYAILYYSLIMNKSQLSKKFGVSNSLVSDIVKKRRWTKSKDLALWLAAITGAKPIFYIHPDVRDAYKMAYPILTSRVKEQIVIVKR